MSRETIAAQEIKYICHSPSYLGANLAELYRNFSCHLVQMFYSTFCAQYRSAVKLQLTHRSLAPRRFQKLSLLPALLPASNESYITRVDVVLRWVRL